MNKESGFLDNKLLNYLPSKLEDLTESVLFNKDRDTAKDWFKGSMSDLDVFGKKNKNLSQHVSKLMSWSSPDTLSRLLGDSAKKVNNDPRGIKKILRSLSKDQLTDVRNHITKFNDALHWADPTDRDTMSISRAIGHALQIGGVGAAALSTPYVAKRIKQHREIEEDPDGRYGTNKSASIVKSAEIDFLRNMSEGIESNSPADLLTGDYKTWKRFPVLPAILTLLATGAYSGTKHLIGETTDKLSDARMDTLLGEERKRLSRAMVAGKKSPEDGVSKEAAEKDGHGNTATRVALPALLALWALLTPSFYKFGKKMGSDTSENAQYKKFVNALDRFDRESPKSTKFLIGDKDSELTQSPGEFLGTRNVTLPTPDKTRASTALDQVFM